MKKSTLALSTLFVSWLLTGLLAQASATVSAVSLANVIDHFQDSGFSGSALIASPVTQKAAEFGHSPQQHFLIGSVSKQFTAAAILKLSEAKALGLQDPVVKYLPKFKYPNVTIHHLLTHTSGLVNFTSTSEFEVLRRREFKDLGPLTDLILQLGVEFPAGTQWSYSNSNYALLAQIVENLAGGTWWSYVRRELTDKAGMSETHFLTVKGPWLVEGHRFDRDYNLIPLEAVEYLERGWAHGAGGLESTPSDLAKWNSALYGGKLLRPESLALMTAAHAPVAEGLAYGYGIFVGKDKASGEAMFSHNGGIPGFVAYNAYFPQRATSVVVLSNVDSAEAIDLGRILIRLELDGHAEMPVYKDIKNPPVFPMAAYPGSYTSKALPMKLELHLINGRLYLDFPGLGEHRLIIRGAYELYDRALGAEVILAKSSTNEFSLKAGGQVYLFQK